MTARESLSRGKKSRKSPTSLHVGIPNGTPGTTSGAGGWWEITHAHSLRQNLSDSKTLRIGEYSLLIQYVFGEYGKGKILLSWKLRA